MPISYEHNLIFIHVPKNAGTSITEAFEMVVGVGHFPTARYIRDYPREWKTFYKFCVVRNPWDRFVSCYEYAKMEKSYFHAVRGPSKQGKHPDYDLLFDKSFEECVDLLFAKKLGHAGWQPQSNWVCNGGDFILDEFIKLEKLPNSFRGVKIPHLNRSIEKDYKTYYNNYTMEKVRDFYEFDIEIFDYSYEN